MLYRTFIFVLFNTAGSGRIGDDLENSSARFFLIEINERVEIGQFLWEITTYLNDPTSRKFQVEIYNFRYSETISQFRFSVC